MISLHCSSVVGREFSFSFCEAQVSAVSFPPINRRTHRVSMISVLLRP